MSDIPDVRLVFSSGPWPVDVWKNQARYFERKTKVEVVGGLEHEKMVEELEEVLTEADDAIVIGDGLGNSAIQAIEGVDSVLSTVLTGPMDSLPDLNSYLARAAARASRKPKIAQKLFKWGDYRVAKNLIEDIEKIPLEKIVSYSDTPVKVPIKNSLLVYSKSCRFSTESKVEELKANSEIAYIDSGSMPFYSKPQEFNKALNDYLLSKKDLYEKRELVKATNQNHSLKKFQKQEVKR